MLNNSVNTLFLKNFSIDTMSKIKLQLALMKDSFPKFMRIMRLTIALLFVASLHVAASGHTQDNVTLNLKSVELRKALINIVILFDSIL